MTSWKGFQAGRGTKKQSFSKRKIAELKYIDHKHPITEMTLWKIYIELSIYDSTETLENIKYLYRYLLYHLCEG